MLYSLINLLEKIPSEFWAVLAGSIFTLLGVVLTNRHDRKEKRIDREFTLKREIFLEAIEAISIGVTTAGKMLNFNIPDNQIADVYSEKIPAITKVNLVGNMETITALAKFNTEFNSIWLRLTSRRIFLSAEVRKRDSLIEEAKEGNIESKRILDMQRDDQLAGINNLERIEYLTSLFKVVNDRVKQKLNEHSELNEKLIPEAVAFARDCIKEISTLKNYSVPLLGCLRRELNMPFDIEMYEKVISESQQTAINNFEEFLNNAIEKMSARSQRG